ncbi:hypothetical protein [Loigolactobacillus jiayinensis]|uniref:hypothetical protein n=1 Tax=Loigolactobacillus jiayinensis TaxID=2486016 RepID=UPI000F7BA839|nr:hypothetical protein [Loigolactobacillus jiayinensis]
MLAFLYAYLLRPKYQDATEYQGVLATAGRLFRQARTILMQMPDKLYASLFVIFVGLPVISSLPTLISLLTGDRQWWQAFLLVILLVVINLGFLVLGMVVSVVVIKNRLPLPKKIQDTINQQTIFDLLAFKTQLTVANLTELVDAEEIPELIRQDSRLLSLWHGLNQPVLPELSTEELQLLVLSQASDYVAAYVLTRDFAGYCELVTIISEQEAQETAYANYLRSNQRQLWFVYAVLALATVIAIF